MTTPEPRSRPVFAFHRPETLHRWVREPNTLRARLHNLPPLITTGLWPAQIEAVFASGALKPMNEMAQQANEQNRIVDEVERRLSVAQEMEATVAASLQRAERVRQSILKLAFAGRLTPRVEA